MVFKNMKITKRQLRQIVKEALNETGGYQPDRNNWANSAADLKHGDSASAMERVLNQYMMDDTWRMEEDALEDLLIDLGPNPTPEDVEATAEEWLIDYRAGKYRPKTREEQQADWDRGASPRTDYGRKA
jgi:hypothetical protein